MDNLPLILAVSCVAIVVCLQLYFFANTKERIKELKSFIPNIKDLVLEKFIITRSILQSKDEFKNFLQNPASLDDEIEAEDLVEVTLIRPTKQLNQTFFRIIYRTNEYLCKNIGTSADFEIIKDICENQIETLENEIHNSLNIPLYLGLGGTFIGIITGLWGVDIFELTNAKTLGGGDAGLQHLLWGVMIAMGASLLGLAFTVWNSAINYKGAARQVDDLKGEYYNFLRRELMPILSTSMASSLNSLKGVLGHFVDKFGRNLDAYASSAELLNDNLEKQHLVLAEINKLSLTRTAQKIAETFLVLKDASESFEIFKSYQEQLKTTAKEVDDTAKRVDRILTKFDNFGNGLSLVVANQNQSSQLQKQFQQAIETHFPTGSEGKEIWRKEFDELMKDAKQASDQLSSQLEASTQYVQNFVTNNTEFFDTFKDMQNVLATLVQYSQLQAKCYENLQGEILNIRQDYKASQVENIELNKSILKAVESMTSALKKMNKE